MPARSGQSALVLLLLPLWGASALLGSCSSPERHDTNQPTVPSCEASNTCGAGGGASLPPINDPPIVAGPCSSGKCIGQEGGTYEGGTSPVPDAASEAAVRADAGNVDSSDAPHPTDAGPG